MANSPEFGVLILNCFITVSFFFLITAINISKVETNKFLHMLAFGKSIPPLVGESFQL